MLRSRRAPPVFQTCIPFCHKSHWMHAGFQWSTWLMRFLVVLCIPTANFWLIFEFKGKTYSFTHLCQGYCESLTIFNACLRRSLESLCLSPGTTPLQYVDDHMICSSTKDQCETDTISLLKHLLAEGHKASLSKLQFVQEKVTFLGHNISGNGKTLSPKRVLFKYVFILQDLRPQLCMSGRTSKCHCTWRWTDDSQQGDLDSGV